MTTILVLALSASQAVLVVLAALTLQRQGNLFMITKQIQDAIGRIDTETTAIGAEITDLAGKVAAGMTQEDADAIAAKLNAQADRLTAIASPTDPNAAPILTTPAASTDTGAADTTSGAPDASGATG